MDSHVSEALDHLYARTRITIAHAWTVRAFVRHTDEAEDYPELTEIGRAVFELSRALETRAEDRVAYFRMLRKKIGKFRTAAEKFAIDAPAVSSHTNFEQAVVSIRGCVSELEEILSQADQLPMPDVTTTSASDDDAD